MSDEKLISEALRLAEKGRGFVSPNPMVGAVITKGGKVIGRGFHKQFGHEHAETIAINSVTENPAGSSLFVNLEPCSHHGNQPPCVDAIIRAGIKTVIVGTTDPNPQVEGSGIDLLRRGNVKVKVGVLEEECQRLNEAFFKYMKTGLPFVTLKIAQTLDGKIADKTGDSKWITSEKARRWVHRLRSKHDAILVGVDTIIQDDPRLNVRWQKGPNPQRIVLDSSLRIPFSARVLNDEFVQNTIVVTTKKAAQAKMAELQARGVDTWEVEHDESGQIELHTFALELAKRGMTSLLVEGGGKIFSAFLRRRMFDRLAIFIAPKLLGAGLQAVTELGIESLENCITFDDSTFTKVGSDLLFMGYPKLN